MSTDTPTLDTPDTTTLTRRMATSALSAVLVAAAVVATVFGALVAYFAPIIEFVGGDVASTDAVIGASVIGLCLASVWIGAVVGVLRVVVDD